MIEMLERRQLLAASIRAIIPTIYSGAATQTPLADTITALQVTPGLGVSSKYLRFSTDDAARDATTSIFAASSLATNAADAALAIFDSGGNLLQIADADATAGHPSSERLDVVLQPKTVYILGVYTFAPTVPLDVAFSLPQQASNTPLKLNTATGATSFVANSGEDTYNGPADPDYYPIDFFNSKGNAVVSVSGVSPDVASSIGIFRSVPQAASLAAALPGTNAWSLVGSASGTTATINLAPAANVNLADDQYELSATPLNFTAPARAYQINVSSATLAPASVASSTPIPLGAILPTTPGQALVQKIDVLSGANVYSFTAPTSGPITLLATNPGTSTALALYDATGATLLAVRSQMTATTYSYTYDVTAGTAYRLRCVSLGNPANLVVVGVRQDYIAQPLSLTAGPYVQRGLIIGGTAGEKFFHVTMPPGADVLSVRIAPASASSGNLTLRIVGPNIPSALTTTATAGNALSAVFDASTFGRDFDLAITADNAGPVDFAVASANVPDSLPTSIALTTVNLATGDASRTSAIGGVNDVQAMKFWALNTGTTSTMTATGGGGAVPVLAQYEERDGILRLVGFTVPNAAGVAQRVATVNGSRLAAIAAISVRPDGAPGSVALALDGATPIGVGIAMAPEPVPTDVPYTPPFTANLRVRKVPLRSANQRDLWQTSFPYNTTTSPTLSIGPAMPGGALALRVQVMNQNNVVLQTITTTPGQSISNLALSGLTAAGVAGQTLRFLVEPIGNNLGAGLYTLEVQSQTSDPSPYIVNEVSFSFSPVLFTPSLPTGEPIRTVNVNSFGDSSFTDSRPYNTGPSGRTGSIDVFKFVHGATPFSVWTEDLDASVNTNIKLYRGRAGGVDEVPGASFNLDYTPGDRSKVDARLEMWNTYLAASTFSDPKYTANTWYVVVKNEGGSLGNYRLHVDDLPAPDRAGPGVPAPFPAYGLRDIDIDPRNGNISSQFSVNSGDELRLTTPSSLFGLSTLTLTPSANSQRTFEMDLFDSQGNFISSQTQASSSAVGFVLVNLSAVSQYILLFKVVSGPAANSTIGGHANVFSSGASPKPGAFGALTNPGTYNVPAHLYSRANQFADGTFASTSNSNNTGGAVSMLQEIVFWVDQPGAAEFKVTNSAGFLNRVLGLWRGDKIAGEFGYVSGTLRDFTTTAQADGSLTLDAVVMPGMYFLTVEAANNTIPSFITTAGQLPKPVSALITLNPSDGTTRDENMQRIDPLLPSLYPLEDGNVTDFRTSFYKVVTPGGSDRGLVSSTATYNEPPAGNTNAGRAFTSITRLTGTAKYYTGEDASINLDGTSDDLGSTVTSTDLALPGDEYYIGISRDRMAPSNPYLHFSASYHVPQSGTPDIVVDPIRFDAANGQTKVTITLHNLGYASAGPFHSKLHFSNMTGDSIYTIPGFGPFATQSFSYLWTPTNGTDTVSYVADFDRLVDERSETNNAAVAALNKSRPVISSITLADPLMDGDSDANVWGRYVSGVAGATTNIIVTPADADGQADIYRTYYTEPRGAGAYISKGGAPFTRSNFDFSDLLPTSAANPNRFSAYVVDQWGLKSDPKYVSANVVAKSQFLTAFTFDRASRTYALGYDNDIVRYDKSINDILGASLPLIGDKRQKFILHLGAHGTASLDPTAAVSLPLGADIELTAFDSELYKKTWTGSTAITDNFMVGTTLDVSARTLDVTAAAASFQLRNLNLLDIRTPKIPLFAYGIPGVADLSANFSLGMKAGISAGLKIGIDPNILNNPLQAPSRVGLMSPTFVQPRIEGSAYITGEVDVLGFDIADLEGRVSLGLNITVGIDNADPSKVIPFDQLADHLKFNVTGDLSFGLSAHVAILGEIWSFDPDPITFPIGGDTVEGIITDDPGIPGSLFTGPSSRAMAKFRAELADLAPTVKRGSDLVGAYQLDAAPQLQINPSTGYGMSVQVVDGDPTDQQTRGQLVFATRASAAAAWSSLSPIPGAGDVASPVLVATHNGATPYMVVYEMVDLPGNTQDQTFAQRLAARDLRYRTWNGTTWSSERVLAGPGGGDSGQAVAFSPGGNGVAAWVRNTASVEMGEDGRYAGNQQEILASLWDGTTQSWRPSQSLTLDSVADSKPAVFADDNRAYVVWVRANGAGSDLYFATNDGSGWTTPAILPINGLVPGGGFTSVALGREASGRINVLFNYRVKNADRSLDSKLYNRPTTVANFAQPSAVEVIAQDTNFSSLQTTNRPDGALVASWKAGDGVTNEIFASTLIANATAWSKPAQLTQDSDTIEARPNIAIEPDGRLQALYEVVQAGSAEAPAVNGAPTADGVGGSTAQNLPELGFTRALDFDSAKNAVIGATATGRATIINRGIFAADVTIDFLRGPPHGGPTVLGSRVVHLAPGATYDATFDFSIAVGLVEYSMRLSTTGGEIVGTADNYSTHTLNGMPDLELVSFGLQDPAAAAGPSNPFVAHVKNRSSVAIGAFNVDFRRGDELFPQYPWSSLATVSVPSIAPGAEIVVTASSAAATATGLYAFSVFADSSALIAEASEANNRRSLLINHQADVGLVPTGITRTVVNATLLDASGVNNVRVTANLSNFASGADALIPSGAVTVCLLRSIDGADFVQVDSQTFASIAAGASINVQFVTSGLSGSNVFRVVVDPASGNDDSNPTNDVGEATLQIAGLADLSPTNAVLSRATVQPGDALSMSIDIANDGIAAARGVLVEVIAHQTPGDGGLLLGSFTIDQLDALSSTSISIPIDTSGLDGTFQLFVVVNRNFDIAETTDANNTFSPQQIIVGTIAPYIVSTVYQFETDPSLLIVFSKPTTNFDVSDIQLVSLVDGTTIPTNRLSVQLSADGLHAQVRYTGSATGVLPDGRYVLKVAAGSFADSSGKMNLAYTGVPFFVLGGDANRDGIVDFNDLVVLAQNYGKRGLSFSGGNFSYSTDGAVDFDDLVILAQNYGKSITNLAAGNLSTRLMIGSKSLDTLFRRARRAKGLSSIGPGLSDATPLNARRSPSPPPKTANVIP